MERLYKNRLIVGEEYYLYRNNKFDKKHNRLKGTFIFDMNTSLIFSPVYMMNNEEFRSEHSHIFPNGISRCFVYDDTVIYRKTKIYNKIMYKVLSLILDDMVAKSLSDYL